MTADNGSDVYNPRLSLPVLSSTFQKYINVPYPSSERNSFSLLLILLALADSDSRTIVIISPQSHIHSAAPKHHWCKYFERVRLILILHSIPLLQAVISITRWETRWNMASSDTSGENVQLFLMNYPPVITPSMITVCSPNIMSARLWGTIAHLPRSSRKSPQ